MKRRAGLVSNSSSSSYICVFGRIVDNKKFDTYCKKHNIKTTPVDGELLATTPIWQSQYGYEPELQNFFIPLDKDFGHFMPSKKDLMAIALKNPEYRYVLYGGIGDGGEGASGPFYVEGQGYCYDLLDLSYFSEDLQAMFIATIDSGFECLEYTVYAGMI